MLPELEVVTVKAAEGEPSAAVGVAAPEVEKLVVGEAETVTLPLL